MPLLSPDIIIPFAEQLATMSGEIIRKYYGKQLPYEIKADASPVTKADQEVEQTLRALILSTYPDHGIIGEEFGPKNEGAEYTWIIDPIDGTKSFMIGRPIFGTLIALLHHREPVLGILDQPILGERWTGAKGFATYFGSQTIHTRPCPLLKHAVFCTTSPNLFEGQDVEAFERIRKGCRYAVYGGDCYSYGLLAKGGVDIILETDLKIHDFCALRPIIEGAGGIITDWQGHPLTADSDGRVLACGDKALHAQALELIAA